MGRHQVGCRFLDEFLTGFSSGFFQVGFVGLLSLLLFGEEGRVGSWWVASQQGLAFRFMAAGKDAIEGIVVFDRNRIILVGMAASACDGQAHRSTKNHINPVIDDVMRVVQKTPPQCEKTQSSQWSLILPQIHEVCCDLLFEEKVIGQVLIEGSDQVIPIGVGVRIAAIRLKYVSLRVGVACDIHPVSCPAFTIVR